MAHDDAADVGVGHVRYVLPGHQFGGEPSEDGYRKIADDQIGHEDQGDVATPVLEKVAGRFPPELPSLHSSQLLSR